jgi:hypothetical protein
VAENLDPLRRLEPLCYNHKDDWSRIMNAKIKALSEQARRLSPEERIELIEDLLGSIEPLTRKSIGYGLKKHATVWPPL